MFVGLPVLLARRIIEDCIGIRFPSSTGSQQFSVIVFVRNKSSGVIDGLVIDFSPSKHYLKVVDAPDYIIRFPPIHPGMEIEKDIGIHALFRGRLVIFYRICTGDNCVNKKAEVSIGGEDLEEIRTEVEKLKRSTKVSIRSDVSSAEVKALKARYVELLGRYAVAALREGWLGEAVEALDELLYYTSKYEKELARAICDIETYVRNGICIEKNCSIYENLIKRIRLITAKIAAETKSRKI